MFPRCSGIGVYFDVKQLSSAGFLEMPEMTLSEFLKDNTKRYRIKEQYIY